MQPPWDLGSNHQGLGFTSHWLIGCVILVMLKLIVSYALWKQMEIKTPLEILKFLLESPPSNSRGVCRSAKGTPYNFALTFLRVSLFLCLNVAMSPMAGEAAAMLLSVAKPQFTSIACGLNNKPLLSDWTSGSVIQRWLSWVFWLRVFYTVSRSYRNWKTWLGLKGLLPWCSLTERLTGSFS